MQTFGWDTIFVLGLDQVNDALAANRDKYLTKLIYPSNSTAQGKPEIPVQFDAELDAWQIVSSGSGKLLHLLLPIRSGRLVFGTGSSAMSADLGGVGVILEINLALLPSTATPLQQNLCFSFKRVAQNPNDQGPGVVSPYGLVDPTHKLNSSLSGILPSLIAGLLVENAQSMSYVFAMINLVKPGTGSWLSPVQCDYAYFNSQNGRGYFAILGVNDNRDISGLSRQLDGSTIPPSGDALYLISQELFLKNIILPSLPQCYGTSADVFLYDSNKKAINNTRSFGTQSVRVGAIDYSPSIDALQISVDGGDVITSIAGSCSLGLGINMTFGIQSRNSMVFDASSKAISFIDDGSPTVQHDASIPWYDWFLGPIPDAIMAIVIPIIAGKIAGGLQSSGTGLTIGHNPPTSVIWNGMSRFDVSAAGLNDSLFLSGNVQEQTNKGVSQMLLQDGRNHSIQVRFPELMQKEVLQTLEDTGAADTFGWDTVFAIRVTDANTALQKRGSTPAAFSIDLGGGYTANGNFDPWQISIGGDGENLHMSVPVSSGTMTFGGKSNPMDHSTATIEVKLQYIPQPPSVKANAVNGNSYNLVVQTKSGTSTGPVVSVIDLAFENPPSDPSVKYLMMGALTQWFNDNIQEFNHVFATVDLNVRADKDQFQWMKPTTTSYAYADGDDADSSYFGVLCLTENRGGTNLKHQLSSNVIPSGNRAGFLISGERFLEKLVLPGLPTLFQSASATDFTMSDDGTQIYNKQALNMNSVQIGASNYTPKVEQGNFSITLEAGQLVLDLKKVHVEFSPGIDIYMNYTSYSTVELVTKSDGSQALNYKEARPATTEHYIDVASWVIWTEVIAGVVAGVITAFVGKGAAAIFEKIVYRVIATVIALIVTGLIAAIPEILTAIADGDKDKLPSVDLMVENLTNPINWPGGTGFTLTAAGISGPLQLGGDPGFAQSRLREVVAARV